MLTTEHAEPSALIRATASCVYSASAVSSSSMLFTPCAKDLLDVMFCRFEDGAQSIACTPLSSCTVRNPVMERYFLALPSGNCARSRAVRTPNCERTSAFAGPTPHTSSAGHDARAASQSISSQLHTPPYFFAILLHIFASVFVGAMPAETGTCTWCSASFRICRASMVNSALLQSGKKRKLSSIE